MNSFYYMLQLIRKRPGLYLGVPSLNALVHFWHGYDCGICVEKWEKETGRNYFDNYDEAIKSGVSSGYNFTSGFLEYVADYYNISSIGGMGWQTIILKNTESDEEAFYKFFELLDIFLEQKEILLSKD